MKCSPALKLFQDSVLASFTLALPLMICIVSALVVAKLYSPGVITPMLAGDVLLVKLIDFTAPLKYSLVFSIVRTLEFKGL